MLRNRLPGKYGKTPYKMLNYRQPDLAHIRVLGIRVQVYIPKEKRTNEYNDRLQQGIHVSYEGTNYRIYNPKRRTTIVSRDVTVDEDNIYNYKLAGIPEDLQNEADDKEFGNLNKSDDEALSNRSVLLPILDNPKLPLTPSPSNSPNFNGGTPDFGGSDYKSVGEEFRNDLDLVGVDHGGQEANDDLIDPAPPTIVEPRRLGRERHLLPRYGGDMAYDPNKIIGKQVNSLITKDVDVIRVNSAYIYLNNSSIT